MTALSGLTIVETAERVCGEWTGRLLADFGADVIKVERPGGSPTRRFGPHVTDAHGQGESAIFAYCNTNKKSVVLDLNTAEGRAALDRLFARADALVDDHDPRWAAAAGLDPVALRARHGALVHCHITPFGLHGPQDRQRALPINIAAAGGWAWHTPSESDPADPPVMGAGRFMQDYDTGLDAAIATSAALLRQRRTGKGQSIAISEVAVQMSRADVVLGRVLAGDDEPGHSRRRYDMGGPGDVFACADGHVHLVMMTRNHWAGLKALMDHPGWAAEFPDDWLEFHCTPERVAAFREAFRPWMKQQNRNAISERGQKLGVPLVPVNTAADLLANAQYRHRGFFQSLAHPVLGVQDYPTAPYRMTASPVRLTRPAPAPDADRAEVLP
jgi:crotonobetainyl-CoA:carnitine CoA-transferase CaiB-like acyl-CoA transferase